MSKKSQLKSLPWDVVEKAIAKEIEWLKDVIETSPYYGEKVNDNFHRVCEDSIYRRIAFLIVSGRVKARDIESTICLWGKEKSFPIGKSHGKEWHTRMMRLVGSYFQSLKFDVAIEPKLNLGRADLGIYKKDEMNLFVEIGTVSLPKLLFNLESMENSVLLVVLASNHVVEFCISKAGYKNYSI